MNTLEAFEHTYEGLGDALLKHVSLAYSQENQPRITVVLECWSLAAEEWVYLEIRFTDVQEYCIVSKRQDTLVVVEGFVAHQLGDVFVFNFAPSSLGPETMDEHRQSRFYVACTKFNCQEIEWPGS